MYKIIEEGKVRIKVSKENKVSKELSVFYNPVMKLNRDISVLLLKSIEKKDLMVALPLAGSGVRGLRFVKELSKKKIKELWINDIDKNSIKIIKQNLKLNNISDKRIKIFNMDANKFILESSGFDYIDIDPFGSPNFLLNNSIVRISRGGILAVTATDTGCLCGSFSKACKRKYWATPKKDSNMHENGLRILIRKVQLIGAEHDKALTPILSYSKDHYFRVFFICEKGKKKADDIISLHGIRNDVGPMWLGGLWDTKLINNMVKENKEEENQIFLDKILSESKIHEIGFYSIHDICKKNKISTVSFKDIISSVKKNGYKVSRTHIKDNSIRSNIPKKELINIIKKLNKK